MDIRPLFKKDLALFGVSFPSKKAALTAFGRLLQTKGYAQSATRVLDLALKREKECSTGIGEKIAIPHIRDAVMKTSVVLFAKIKPLDWGSLDNRKVEYVFFIAMKNDANVADAHLGVIAGLSRLFMKPGFTAKLAKTGSYGSLIQLLENFLAAAKKTAAAKPSVQTPARVVSPRYDVVAVTACPTGIAHTFMAAQKLEDAAKQLNLKIKVETQGTEGSRNTLSPTDIRNAKGIVLACDKMIDLTRFQGAANVLEISTGAAIKNAAHHLKAVLRNEGKKMGTAPARSQNASSFSADAGQMMSFAGFGKRL